MIRKYIYVCATLLFSCAKLRAQPHSTGFLIDSLNDKISQSNYYDDAKEKEINGMRKENAANPNDFNICLKLYEAYKEYNYDSAFKYALDLQRMAIRQKNDSLYEFAKLKQCFILVSSGMFKEAFDSLNTINPAHLPPAFRADYYTSVARCYYDLADYDNDKYHSANYNKTGGRYLDSLLLFYPDNSFEAIYYKGLKEIRSDSIENATKYLRYLMTDSSLTLHQIALVASTLSDICIQKGETDSAVQLLVQAAVADIKTSTKETTAIFNLSTLLYKKGDIKDASLYIKKAMNDAVFYGAKQRKMQLSSVLALIESQRVANIEQQTRNAIIYGIIATILLLVLASLVIIIFRQMRKLKKAEQTISKAHRYLQDTNVKLEEANKIKEEYLGYFFNGNSEVYTKVERFKKNIEKKVHDRKLDEILFLVNNFNLREDKHELLSNFDKIFLKLFPHFVEQYNALFSPENQTDLKENNSFPTEVRIFALIRLGIHDNEKIAEILGYSVNTINTYKTKTKNKSLISNEQFEKKIMEIKSV